MGAIAAAQFGIFFLLSLAALVLTVMAVADAVRHPAGAYQAAGKLSKPAWVGITAVAFLLVLADLLGRLAGGGGGFGFLVLLPVVAAGIYLADVRPALRSVGGGRRGSGSGPIGW